ncbi:barstar family protein [Rhodococcus sp. BP-349]|uniref:barstar family protein n=1 Tax=unclassified Rhodococcus (in: high G+C Gram-positive bacteria) TaxID=192944 RepID=UPI001C9A80E2|nr:MULTISPECIES: barstar family protein [unclassified Rhodococcus (in: high G+C Gram-positive bacteria)]MBY6540287.1 barstar family protein [Rhodococcus sp. BP-363]MBY6545688.1 barstar family protein [Rhodococcus sp. BP-369]MBY6564918.1 barstar family protein [Rhodococcus sp. BP-370]MBY6578146.1 barstar family protein [Rhodococcus sp. BP-364]MBY6587447.1 barstar family protein [Rhodococcus sp. BP-358]
MPRSRGVFDPTDRELFDQQRQRFDWAMLQNGCVYRYDTAFGLDSACARLRDLGYLVHRLDAANWSTVADMHAALATAMSFPDYYGGSVPAFDDVLSYVAQFAYGSDPASSGTVVAIAGYDTVTRLDRRTADLMLDVFAHQARLAALYAHPMLCLVESIVTDYPPVGGRSVYSGPVWDTEPDPPCPFSERDLVELTYQFYADDTGASAFAAALRDVLADMLTTFGRWQMLTPVAASERAAAIKAEQRPKPPQEGTRLWEIGIGIRGAGDLNDLDSRLAAATYEAGVRFEQLGMLVHAAGTEYLEDALTRFPALNLSEAVDDGIVIRSTHQA